MYINRIFEGNVLNKMSVLLYDFNAFRHSFFEYGLLSKEVDLLSIY